MFRNTGANAFAKNQTRLAYEDKRDLYCTSEGCRIVGPTGGRNPRLAWGHHFGGAGDSAGRMVSLHGARPKWNRLGRPTPVIEEPRGLGVEATGGIDGLEVTEGGMRAPAPQLPPPRQDR